MGDILAEKSSFQQNEDSPRRLPYSRRQTYPQRLRYLSVYAIRRRLIMAATTSFCAVRRTLFEYARRAQNQCGAVAC